MVNTLGEEKEDCNQIRIRRNIKPRETKTQTVRKDTQQWKASGGRKKD